MPRQLWISNYGPRQQMARLLAAPSKRRKDFTSSSSSTKNPFQLADRVAMQTPRLELVRITKDHLPGFHAIWSDPIATRWSPHGVCKTLKDSEEWLSGILLENNPLGENYAVIFRSNIDLSLNKQSTQQLPTHEKQTPELSLPAGFLLGVVGTWRSDPVPEIGFIYNRAAWGYGFATEALTAFLKLFWKAKPQFDVVEGYCDSENLASSNVMQKAGFQLVESLTGDYSLPLMDPPLRNSFKYRATRPKEEGESSS